jgi:hypothetical protein
LPPTRRIKRQRKGGSICPPPWLSRLKSGTRLRIFFP